MELKVEPVTVWWASLGRWAARDAARAGLAELLDPAERTRRARYLRDADRDRFTLGVAITRVVAGRRSGLAPEQVPITRRCRDCDEPHGPPAIAGGPHLSVSHSGDLVAVAVSPYGPLGVDVEEDSGRIGDDIARHLLADDEPPAAGAAGLLAYWTRKEALLKATGDGLRVPLGALHVSAPHEPPRLRAWDGRPDLPARTAMRVLDAAPGHAACLALIDHPEGVPVRERDADEILREAADRI
jgi:4'-phosphopantetheinyl transferase